MKHFVIFPFIALAIILSITVCGPFHIFPQEMEMLDHSSSSKTCAVIAGYILPTPLLSLFIFIIFVSLVSFKVQTPFCYQHFLFGILEIECVSLFIREWLALKVISPPRGDKFFEYSY